MHQVQLPANRDPTIQPKINAATEGEGERAKIAAKLLIDMGESAPRSPEQYARKRLNSSDAR
jgi:hypothetical protein